MGRSARLYLAADQRNTLIVTTLSVIVKSSVAYADRRCIVEATKHKRPVKRTPTRSPEMPDKEPLAPSDRGILILTSLAEGDKHGYALMKDIEAFAGVTLQPATLYSALSRLEASGLVEPLEAVERRKPYRITPAGSRALKRHLSESEKIARLGLQRLALNGR
jgi:DNA-binding PadR family transcriptional regulator